MQYDVEDRDRSASVDDGFDPAEWVQSRLSWEVRLTELRSAATIVPPAGTEPEIAVPAARARRRSRSAVVTAEA